jgi:hypothetical protein
VAAISGIVLPLASRARVRKSRLWNPAIPPAISMVYFWASLDI